jgi:hypothetical protein
MILRSALALFVSTGMASALTVTFDDLSPSSHASRPIPAGYQGLNWSNFYYEVGTPGVGTGNGVVSPNNVAVTGGTSVGTIFDPNGVFNLDSAYVTAGWLNGMTVTVDGYQPGNPTPVVETFTVNESGPKLVDFTGFTGVDEVKFSGKGGLQAITGSSSVPTVVLDNITLDFNDVPDASSTVWLLGAAMGGLGLLRRKLS